MAAAERIIPLFVLMVAFIVCSIMLMDGARNFVSSNIDANTPSAPDINDFTMGLISYDIFSPSIHTVNVGQIHDHMFKNPDAPYGDSGWEVAYTKIETFTPSGSTFGEHDVAMWAIRNNTDFGARSGAKNTEAFIYHDFLFFYQRWWTNVVEMHGRYAAVSYDTIVAHADASTNVSKSYLQLMHGYVVMVSPYGPYNVSQCLYLNHFNVTFLSPKNESIKGYGPWAMLGYIMTFSLPDVNWQISLLIGMPFDCGIVFGVVELIRRFIPLLGG